MLSPPTDPIRPTKQSSGPLEDVKHLKVSLSNPPSSSEDGIDFLRCSALHNAIVKHQWKSIGWDLAEMPTTTWWQTPEFASQLDQCSKAMPGSLVEFLKRALHPEFWPQRLNSFFHFVSCLGSPESMWRETLQEPYDDETERIALYMVTSEMRFGDDTLDGVIYDYRNHACMYNSYDSGGFRHQEDIAPLPWQYLETMLTAWIEMIERGKAIVLQESQWPQSEEDELALKITDRNTNNAWAWTRYTESDVEDTIAAWDDLVYGINERLPQPLSEPFPRGLFEVSDLIAAGIREDSFAWQFYRRAIKPAFRFLGPGRLQLPSREQLLDSPFEAAWKVNTKHPMMNHKPTLPLPILLGEQSTTSWVDEHGYKVDRPVICGLYLDKFCNWSISSYEEGARLVLPALNGNTPARMLDGKKAGPVDLYQIGQSPFQPDHPTQLWYMLRRFQSCVASGSWCVDADGVNEPLSRFEADEHPEPDSEEADALRDDDLHCIYIAGSVDDDGSWRRTTHT